MMTYLARAEWGVLSGTRRLGKMDGSEMNVVAGSWNWRSAMNMAGCRWVGLSSTYLAIK